MTIIDPPSGWKYGFPKPIPEERKKDVLEWLVEQGYPKSLIDELGEHFYCQYWEMALEKQKALELVEYFETSVNKSTAKQFALRVCSEVLGHMGADRGTEFWNSVKQEIENL